MKVINFVLATFAPNAVGAFRVGPIATFRSGRPSSTVALRESVEGGGVGEVKALLAESFPEFSALIESNDAVWKPLLESKVGFTLFAPNSQAFDKLGEKKRKQIFDPRNLEVQEKMGSYHAIPEPVTADDLFNAGGVITLGGDIPTFLLQKGIFGFGGGNDEDASVTINGAKLLSTTEIGNCIVHEVDGLVSPKILWRYIDQLRIPGSS